ncbi:hypothetical protein CEXT_630281 [Caerostris extrusa]|uniref:Uncharacterized protein n=1 Tax=Caerostris extrusa TaxID=172846 RepID=A0AAV4V6D0_CAEEX|nr:hypothetical protein CEXT_630281 [Caerostris extrusa]
MHIFHRGHHSLEQEHSKNDLPNPSSEQEKRLEYHSSVRRRLATKSRLVSSNMNWVIYFTPVHLPKTEDAFLPNMQNLLP